MTVKRMLIAAGVAVLVAVILGALGFPFPFVAGAGVAIGSLVLLIGPYFPEPPTADAPRIPVEPDMRSTEISHLAWSLNPKTGLAGERITRRVRETLRHRLERIGLDPDAPGDRARCDALLGRELWLRLAGQGTTITDIANALSAIDRLSPTKEKQ